MSGVASTLSTPDKAAVNRSRADGYREHVAARGVKHFINEREWLDSVSGETFETLSPIDNSVICTVASGGAGGR